MKAQWRRDKRTVLLLKQVAQTGRLAKRSDLDALLNLDLIQSRGDARYVLSDAGRMTLTSLAGMDVR
jgi:hypothetical protein